MFRIVLVLLLLYLVWLLLFLLYERKRRKKGAPQKEPCQTVREAEIIGKSRFKISHSTPQVRSYPKGEAEAKKASTFALENGQEPSEEPDEQPDIDEIPLTYGSSDAPSLKRRTKNFPYEEKANMPRGLILNGCWKPWRSFTATPIPTQSDREPAIR